MTASEHKVLVVEDDQNKASEIRRVIESAFPKIVVEERRSYRSAVRALLDWQPDLVLLDMTLPTFDVTTSDSGGRPRIFGGKDILFEMDRRGVVCPVILVTQFESFGEGTRHRTLEEVTGELASAYPHLFKGTVYYHAAQSAWRADLERMLNQVLER